MTTQTEAQPAGLAEMLPCPNPWCESHTRPDRPYEPFVENSRASHEKRVSCPVCPMAGPWADCRIDALVAWNLRTPATEQPVSAEVCRRCGHENPSWSAPSPLWNAVIRGGDINGNALFDDTVCASCFIALATGIASGFRVIADEVHVPLQTITPSGRVWNAEKHLWLEQPAEASDVVEALDDAAATLAAVRATASGDDWDGPDTARHFHDLCGETLLRLKSAKAALSHPRTEEG